ncbi:MAG: response regulator [Desulfobacteraceae bacterium]|nr:MAG: response regulator [Desulfobacteraceae bacterium]
MRVLLVDDEEEFVVTLTERLSLRGIDAEYATSSYEAIKKAETSSFDAAVLDLRMPKMGGLALREVLVKMQPKMKFIFLTGYGSEEDFNIVSAQSGTNFYLVKPVEIMTLIEKLREVVNRKGDANGNENN